MGVAPSTEVDLDSRQRLPMAKIVREGQHRFRVESLPGGDYLLTPVVSISERELAVLRNPETVAAIREGLDQAARGDVAEHEPGYFSALAAALEPESSET